MPSINHQRHYQPLEARIMTVSEEPLDIDNLARCIAAHSDIAIEQISTALNKHAGIDSSYTFKPRLIETLKQLHAALEQDNLSKDNKVVIASKLTEELNSCTPGFENRTIEIILSLQRPTTMDDFLELIRRDIVDVAARAASSDVHSYNQFFIFAAQHYGVRSINPDDVYAHHELDESEQTQLTTAFNTHYRFAHILDNLLNVIKSELSNYYGYHGHHEEGYDYATYQPIVNFFRKITGQQEATHQELLVIVNDDTVTDINWLNCYQMIVNRLVEDAFFELSDLEQDFFDALNHNDPNILESLLKHDDYRLILKQLDILQHPELLTCYPKKNAQIVINNLLECHGDELTLKRRIKRLTLYKAVYSRQLDIIEAIVNWLNHAPQLSPQFKAEYLMSVLKHDKDNFPYALKLMSEQNSIDEQGHILSATNQSDKNLLIMATESSADALIALLRTMQTLPLKLQETLWSKKHGSIMNNILMNTIKKNRNQLEHLLFAIDSLPLDLQTTIWTTKNRDNERALNMILEYQPMALTTAIRAIKKLPPEAQQTIWTASDYARSSFDNALMNTIRHRPNSLPDVISAIQKLPPKIQDAIWTSQNSVRKNALRIAMQSQPDLLPTIIRAIQKLSFDAQESIWTARDNIDNNNALIFAINNKPNLLPTIISAIQKLSLGVQKSIWIARDRFDNNVLVLAINNIPDLLPVIMNAIEQLPPSTQQDLFKDIKLNALLNTKLRTLNNIGIKGVIKKSLPILKLNTQESIAMLVALPDIIKLENKTLLTYISDSRTLPSIITTLQKLPLKVQGYIWSENIILRGNCLMVALKHCNDALPAIIGVIQTLLPEDQKQILSATDSGNNNILINAVMNKTQSLPALIQAIQALPKETQELIWSATKSHTQDTILTIAKQSKFTDLPILMKAIEQLSLTTQAKLLSAKELTASLNREITLLSDKGLEGAIKKCLQGMHYNKTEKQIAVLTALKDLRETAIDGIEGDIRQAVNDRASPLYQALNIKRYPFRFFRSAQSETGSLQTIKNAPMILGH